MRLPAALVAALLVLAAEPVAAAAVRCDECLRAGAAMAPLRVLPGTPLGGYGARPRRLLVPDLFERYPHAFWFKPHQGELDPPSARALVIETGRERLVWVAADLIAVDRAFTGRLARQLEQAGLEGATLILSASHTHSGPGAYLDSAVMGVLAVDRDDPAVRGALVDGLVEVVRRAAAARRPARVGAITLTAPALTEGRLAQAPDNQLVVLKVVSEAGSPLAVLWNYAIHGTMLGPGNLSLSGDVMGIASRQLERELGVPALFINGAVADVSPARHGLAEARAAARELAGAVRGAWSGITPARGASLRLGSTHLALPAPRLALRSCAGGFVPRWLGLPLDGVLPRDAELIAGALGNTAWVTIPGELQSALGRAIKEGASPPWGRVFVAGVSNDYLGYFLTPADSERVTYVACASLYGPETGERLTEVAVGLLKTLGQSAR